MAAIQKYDLPDESLLALYATETGAYVDCFTIDLDNQVNLEDFINAFYTTPLFKVERIILKIATSSPSTDQDVMALASSQSNRFAVWQLAQRTETQILLHEGRTSSWLCVDRHKQGTRLYFGSAVTGKQNVKTGKTEMGFIFAALLGFHNLYSRALLWSAKKRLET